jgi:hypothetical protein
LSVRLQRIAAASEPHDAMAKRGIRPAMTVTASVLMTWSAHPAPPNADRARNRTDGGVWHDRTAERGDSKIKARAMPRRRRGKPRENAPFTQCRPNRTVPLKRADPQISHPPMALGRHDAILA